MTDIKDKVRVNLEVKITNSEEGCEDLSYTASHILEQVTVRIHDQSKSYSIFRKHILRALEDAVEKWRDNE